LVDVSVVIPTFRRPLGLVRLLHALEELETTATLSILVADNDATLRQGEQVCEELCKGNYRWPLRSIIVAERGLSPVRNALFSQVLKDDDAPFIAMLDDDEWPTKDWLENFLNTQHATGADILQGPVVCKYPKQPSALAELANTCFSPRPQSGKVDVIQAGGNVLLRRSCLFHAQGDWFDARFALTGGEDKDFFECMRRMGASFAYAADALAYTSVPLSRLNTWWALQRAFRSGNCDMHIVRKYDRRMRTLALETAKTVGGLLLTPLFFVASVANKKYRALAMYKFARALGKAATSFGAHYPEYEHTYGD
jgi:succinoglycan biosynthesis protein ExoM